MVKNMETNQMNWTKRLINSFRPASTNGRPKPGRILEKRAEDTWRDYPSSGLTPAKLMAILREADAGSLSAAMQLYEEMEEKDAHLYAVANTRRLAFTGLEWTVVSDADMNPTTDRPLADAAAEHCRKALTQIDSFDQALTHLALAIGRNIAIAELVWERVGPAVTLVDIAPVDFTRIIFDDFDRPRILTEDQPFDGIDLVPNKFIVHAPRCTTGHPARGGLLRVTALVFLAKQLALKDWMIFTETFGMPVRIARYEPSASAEEKREMLRMLESLGSNAAGIFSRAVDLQIIEAGRGTKGPPYEPLIEFLNREISKAWLGQTLTTDTTGARGSFAASAVHEEVRKDVRADDLRTEARTIRRDILAPLARLKFGPDVPVPHFKRIVARADSAAELADLIDSAVNRLGLKVPADWTHETLGIPTAAAGQSPVPGGDG
jgi:phage gp29-like protein